MALDHSEWDKKYFISNSIYNCPFCNRRHVTYEYVKLFSFNWDSEKPCYGWIVRCRSCGLESLHLSFEDLNDPNFMGNRFNPKIDIDSKLFFSQPKSRFAIDSRIPKVIREALAEADECQKMNHLVGASACARKAIFELTKKEGAEGRDYREKIKSLKTKFPNIPSEYFDTLAAIHGMTSDWVHEGSWPQWDSNHLHLISEVLKIILFEIYVVPEKRKLELTKVKELSGLLAKSKVSDQK